MARKKPADPFGYYMYAAPPGGEKPAEAVLLVRALRRGPLTPAEVRKMFPDRAEIMVAAARAAGHRIDSVAFCGAPGWVWCLTENGRFCGVPGRRGVNVPPADKRGLLPEVT